MRLLRRPVLKIPTMRDNGPGGRTRGDHALDYERSATIPRSFPAYWTSPDVKGMLHAIQGRVCAYCGCATNGLDVDHFRPKASIDQEAGHGGYWWLAYECSNYFLCCTVCNRSRKKTFFPLVPGAARCTYHTRDMIGLEQRVLLDPAEDPVEDWLSIDWSDTTARLIPNPNLSESGRARVRHAIDLLGLNLDPEVRTQRSKAYEAAVRAANDRRWKDLQSSAMRHEAHSLMARIVLQRLAPEWLPSPAEEMGALIELLWTNIRTLLDEVRRSKSQGRRVSPVDQRQIDTLGWALVTLRNDPPVGDSAAVDQHFVELLIREPHAARREIIDLFGKLQTLLQPPP